MQYPMPGNTKQKREFPTHYVRLVKACYEIFGAHIIYVIPKLLEKVEKSFPQGKEHRNIYHQCKDALKNMSEASVAVGGFYVIKSKGGSYHVEKVKKGELE